MTACAVNHLQPAFVMSRAIAGFFAIFSALLILTVWWWFHIGVAGHLVRVVGLTLEATGLSTVCDLRGTREAAAAPSRLPPGARAVPLPIEPRIGASLRDLLANGAATRAETTRLLGIAYLNYATEQLPVYRRLVDLILEDERRPLLFHCSAGKDRTGLGAALILTALGVTRDDILADYVASRVLDLRFNPA